MNFRKTTQDLAPLRLPDISDGRYNIYPSFAIGSGMMEVGYDALARRIAQHRVITIDGFSGVLWDHFREALDAAFKRAGTRVEWHRADAAFIPSDAVDRLIGPYLGGTDPLFGTRTPLEINDFIADATFRVPAASDAVQILYGSGAAALHAGGYLIYVDVPKNEVQFRSRAGSITNLGADTPGNPKEMYKRFYFVDWPVLNRHRRDILPTIDLFVDEQRPDEPVFMDGRAFRDGLAAMATSSFRVRPWFEPGPWGGQWIKEHIPGVAPNVPNYAWSFELISPENGIALSSDGMLLEASFDFLMLYSHRDILGDFAGAFGFAFPIRYDFLDTFDGGNLSLQCHPRPEYIHHHFGETFTQDETYYILDCRKDARVFLGFQESIDPGSFRSELERSVATQQPVAVERHVNTLPAHKHDLFLIPNGTVHCSGVNNLVLEISATPYIFTFKMYDWMRLDLDGAPRTLNIERAFENLYVDRKGKKVQKNLVSRPATIERGTDWLVEHLPTHPEHFYDVHRCTLLSSAERRTDGSCHVLSLVEGDSVIVETANGRKERHGYAETFVIPAAAERYTLINENPSRPVTIVATFMKPGAEPFATPEGSF